MMPPRAEMCRGAISLGAFLAAVREQFIGCVIDAGPELLLLHFARLNPFLQQTVEFARLAFERRCCVRLECGEGSLQTCSGLSNNPASKTA